MNSLPIWRVYGPEKNEYTTYKLQKYQFYQASQNETLLIPYTATHFKPPTVSLPLECDGVITYTIYSSEGAL